MRRLWLPGALVLLWELLARSPLGDPLYSPTSLQIADAFYELVTSGVLWIHVKASAFRMIGGFAMAATTAVPIGLAIGYYPPLYRHVMPVFELLRAFPSITLVPIAIVWLGIGDTAKIALVAYASFWPLLLNTVTGVRETSPDLIRAARVMELSRGRLLRRVILPSAFPFVATGVRLSLAVSVIVLIVSEMVAATSGLGFLVLDAERNYRTSEMFAGVLAMGLIGASLNTIWLRAERYFLRHRGTP